MSIIRIRIDLYILIELNQIKNKQKINVRKFESWWQSLMTFFFSNWPIQFTEKIFATNKKKLSYLFEYHNIFR